MRTRTLIFLVIVDVCLLNSASLSVNNDLEPCHFPAIFNFGDSNSDTGGLTAIYGQAHPPNGETFFGRSAGRFCDGRLFIDFFAGSLGLPYLSPYLSSIGSNFSHGANFATAGSTVRPQNTTFSQTGYSPISLNVQFSEFSQFLITSQLFRNQGGVFERLLPKEDYFAKALYTFDIGQNDITAGYKLNMTTEQVKATVPDVIAQLAKVIKGVYGKGGRSFWIHNTGPLGCLAYMLEYPLAPAEIDEFGCAVPFNEAAQFYNAKLKEAVNQLRKEMPLAAITYVDIYSIKHNLIIHAKQYGFETPLEACCGTGGKYNYNSTMNCGFTKLVDGKKIIIAKSCKDPSIKVSWDGTHYTEAANKWIFDEILSNPSYLDPPIPLKHSCHIMPSRPKLSSKFTTHRSFYGVSSSGTKSTLLDDPPAHE